MTPDMTQSRPPPVSSGRPGFSLLPLLLLAGGLTATLAVWHQARQAESEVLQTAFDSALR